ncbi:MAG: glycosyltransferase, partial [Bacteroidota bacterium]
MIEMDTPYLILITLIAILFYSYLGYGIVLWALLKIKRLMKKPNIIDTGFEPEVTFVVAAYNEEECIETKIQNCLALDYPKEKLKLLFVTDGSSDGTVEIIKKYPGIRLEHSEVRAGKIAAVNRIMPMIDTAYTIFCDANTTL